MVILVLFWALSPQPVISRLKFKPSWYIYIFYGYNHITIYPFTNVRIRHIHKFTLWPFYILILHNIWQPRIKERTWNKRKKNIRKNDKSVNDQHGTLILIYPAEKGSRCVLVQYTENKDHYGGKKPLGISKCTKEKFEHQFIYLWAKCC